MKLDGDPRRGISRHLGRPRRPHTAPRLGRLLVNGDGGLEFGLSLPTGSGFATSGGGDPEGEILYAWDFAQLWNLNGNVDFASETQGDDDSSRRGDRHSGINREMPE